MALQLLDVDHAYGRRTSLSGVTLTLEPGDGYGFIGHNGAGKSTALRIALGLMRPRAGRVLVDGFDAARDPVEVRARTRGLADTTGFLPWASGRENLLLLARLAGLDRRRARRETDRWLDAVGLVRDGRRRVGAYSQGMRQRLGLAQALLGEPAYVLLDEPTNGLDPEGIADLKEIVREATAAGRAVLFSSHVLADVGALCNRVGVLKEGRLLVEADTRALLTADSGRGRLATDADDATRAVLHGLGLAFEQRPDRRFDVTFQDVPPAELVRRLVGANVGVEALERGTTTLEEVYLRVEERRAPGPTEPARDVERTRAVRSWPGARAARVVRSWPGARAARVVRYELARGARRIPGWLLVALPAAVAYARIDRLATEQAEHLAAVERGDVFSASTVTAFEATARGLSAGLPLLVPLVAAFASQSIAGELALGTLRNVLTRPLRRFEVALGKLLTTLVVALVTFGALAGTALAAAGRSFEFGDRFEVFRSGERELWIGALDVEPYFAAAFGYPLLALGAYAGLGFVAGALAKKSLWAATLALVAVGALDLARTFARPGGWEWALPSAHVPSLLGDTSYLAFFTDLAIGSAEAYHEYAPAAAWVPLAWGLATFGVGALLLARKRVP